jgi:cyclic beta-1,2-glucan synthetase
MLRGRHAFLTATHSIRSFTGDREEFFGLPGSRSAPRALERAALSGRFGAGLDPCGALQVPLRLAPGETLELSFVLGDADGPAAARSLALKYADDAAVARAFGQVRETWDELLGKLSVKTPDPALDFMLNRWLLYQVTSCRFWARSGYYQSSGAYGFRDQLQDVLALLHTRPELAREHLLRCAARQFVEGDVQHWWHPNAGDGVRTRCSDDLLWLPYAVAEYVNVTGDTSVLDESVEFLNERELEGEEEDLFSVPRVAGSAPLYEHCTRALDRGETAGPHGLPLIGTCDWNDGMNRVGHHGRGESVWLAWFLAKTLADFAEVAERRGDHARVERCRRLRERVAKAADAEGWDGAWYRRAYFDDGAPLGTHSDSECRIDAIAQSWAVISGAANPERAALAVTKSVELLLREEPKTLLLLWPPFEQTARDPGYIKAYPPGIRENGGQYTHGALWTLDAFARLGDGDRVGKLLSLLNPIEHARTRETSRRYRVEPYVVAADIYSAPGHEGRGGWTWYTGSAAWMYRVVLESVLGFVRRGELLSLRPCIPKSWRGFEIAYRHRDSVFSIRVENPNGVSAGVRSVELDGNLVADGNIRLDTPGSRHEVRVVMGQRSSEQALSSAAGSERRRSAHR